MMKCAVITEKSGADWCTIGANTASISADRVLWWCLKWKHRCQIKKWGDSKPSKVAISGSYSKGTNGKMYTSSSIFSYTHMYVLIFSNNSGHNIIIKILTSTSKSVYDYEEKNNLLSWNMDTYNIRKVLCELVQVVATVIACKLWTSQGTMWWKENYNTS